MNVRGRAKRYVNGALARLTGYELRPARSTARRPRATHAVLPEPAAGDRLISAPTFVLSSIRSGSTLVRVLLNSHSKIHAPHELHLGYMSVRFDEKWSERSMDELGLDARSLEHLLWDRILHRELAASGKRHIVEKTPNNVFIADRLRECWPDARFIFLLRHPAAIARSRQEIKGPDFDPAANVRLIHRYCAAVEDARQTHDGHTVRYEDLTADPEGETRRLCEFLGVAFEPAMLDYGRFDHGRFRAGLGDWKETIKTGQVQPAAPAPSPEQISPPLLDLARAWGYLADGAPQAAQAEATRVS